MFVAADVMHIKYYNPPDPRLGLSPLESSRRILAEEAAEDEYREFFWRNRARPEVGVKTRASSATPDSSVCARAGAPITRAARTPDTAFLEEGSLAVDRASPAATELH
jgi:phage portal protein BeeE